MKFLTVGPNSDVPTDGMIYQGIMDLLREAFPGCESEHMELQDNESQIFNLQSSNYDAIIQTGSPFLWHHMERSHKFQNLMTLRQAFPHTPFVFFGIGSCFPLHMPMREILDHMNKPEIRELFRDATIVVRDNVADMIMEMLAIPQRKDHFYKFAPCPSFFINELVHPTVAPSIKSPVIFFKDPQTSISASAMSKTEIQTVYDHYTKFAGLHPSHMTFVCSDMADLTTAVKLGLNDPQLIDTRTLNLNLIARMRDCQVLSGRVHCAIPTHVAGNNVSILGFDTRYESFTNFQYMKPLSPSWFNYRAGLVNILISTVEVAE